MKFHKKIIIRCSLMLAGALMMASCSDILDTKSDMVEFEEDNKLNTAQDTLNSVMGIIREIQEVGDRTVLLGELRGDLMTPTSDATTELKDIYNFQVSSGNSYNKISDYYAVINNCNNFLAKADTTLSHLGKKTFEKEYAVVKAYRAWTYLQLAKVYGKVPLVLDPVLNENSATAEQNKQYSDMQTICNYFIDDIKPYVDTDQPQYGTVGGFPSAKFFIPVRVLLGEMCLWTGRYQESAQYFADYLAEKYDEKPTNTASASWIVSNLNFLEGAVSSSLVNQSSVKNDEHLSIIPMESSDIYGVKSKLADIFTSTENNYSYFQVLPSEGMKALSASQNYCYLSKISDTEKDTVYAPKTGFTDDKYVGDLRYCATFSYRHVNRDETSEYNTYNATNDKVYDNFIDLYRLQQVYLMFAEALNRAGYPETALCILKYGLNKNNIEKYISSEEVSSAGTLISAFNNTAFDETNTQGIHARGCGNVECDTTYCIPSYLSGEALTQYVEDLIITEDALEGAFEGWRYYDLMRVALRRNDPSYLALPVSKREGSANTSLYNLLMDTSNWYLPVQ